MPKPPDTSPPPLGIIAGSGELPGEVIAESKRQNRPVFAIAFEGITKSSTVADIDHQWVHIGKVGEILRALKAHNVKQVLMAGRVGRPSFSTLKMDYSALKLLTKLLKLKSMGDDKVFSTIISFLEQEGFAVVGVEDVLSELVIPVGALADITPDTLAHQDINLGREAALTIGTLDIGQAVIVQQGQILGVEGAEGTDRLVDRCKELHMEGPGGVLVKMKKPGQDTRVDLPSIGVQTLINAKACKLRGIAVEAGGSLVINRREVIQKANELGLFVVGIPVSAA